MTAIADGVSGNRGNRAMTYDALDRLTDVTSPMYDTIGAHYAYDAFDNLTEVTAPTTAYYGTHAYCYDASWHLTNIKAVTCAGATVMGLGYDVQGNLSNRNGVAYGFDYGNRLRSTSTQRYRYDASGRRVRASDTLGAGLIYSLYGQGGQLYWTRDERAGKQVQHIYLGGSLIAQRVVPIGTGTEIITWQHTDALGTPVAVTSSSKTVLQTSEYEPYGYLLNRTLEDGPGYTGHVLDAATGMVYMQQRYYDPGIGRFLSVDPVTVISMGGASFNRYWYAGNNPYRFKDPDGRVVKYANAESEALSDATRKESKVADNLWRKLDASKNEWTINLAPITGGTKSENQSHVKPQDPVAGLRNKDGSPGAGSGGTININTRSEIVNVQKPARFGSRKPDPTEISKGETLVHEMGHAVEIDAGIKSGDVRNSEINGNARKVEDQYREEQGLPGFRSGVQ